MKKCLTTAAGLLIVLSLAVYYRTYTVFFPQFRPTAQRIVDQEVRHNIFEEINKKYPGRDDLRKAKLFESALADYQKENRAAIKKRVKAEFDQLKDRFQDKRGHTYLLELDCWHWARYVENIDRLGRLGDEIKDGKQHDNLMFFPRGNDLLWNSFFYYLSWFCYKVFSLAHPMAIFNFLFYLPLFFIAVFVVILYSFCYRYWGNLVAVTACLVTACGPIFIARSSAGWFDMDILNMIYPVLIIWTYLAAQNSVSWRNRILWSVFSAFWLGLFCATWIGWPFILFIVLFYEFIVLANEISEKLQYGKDVLPEIKKHLAITAVFIFSGVFWIIMFSGLQPLESLFAQVKEALVLNKPLTASIWPNVYFTVGELKKGDYLSIAKSVGGVYILALGLVAMLGIFLNLKKYRGIQKEALLILVVWFMTMFFFCSQGIRFAMFLLVPLGIFLGWGIKEMYSFFSGNKKFKLGLIPLGLVAAWLACALISNAGDSAEGTLPLMDDTMYSVMKNIEKYTPADSVINSWWDYGDFFKVVGKRRVIFDGQSQNTPQAYWMARVLLTDSEQEAIGILRMLNNGGNKAFEITDKYVANPFLSVSLIKRAIMMPAEKGKALLDEYLPPEASKEVADILYSRPKQDAYFVVDPSMIGKIYPISYLGNWDFIKVYLTHVIRLKPQEAVIGDLMAFGLDRETAADYYQQASLTAGREYDSWVSRRSSILGMAYQKRTDDDLVLFNNGFIYNPDKRTVYSYASAEERYHVPRSLFLVNDSGINEELFNSSDVQYSAMILRNKELFKLVLLSPDLARSMFVRLQFLAGRGLKHFSIFTREGEEQNQIAVYRIIWDQF